ncbi:MAG: hypothetical protein ACRDC6_01845 [Shewanella sp.]
MINLTACLVFYNSDVLQVKKVIGCLYRSVLSANVSLSFVMVNNYDGGESFEIERVMMRYAMDIGVKFKIIRSKNYGFGIAHNKGFFSDLESDYHIVINPDLEVDEIAIKNAISFMILHPECGLLSPYATWGDGQVQRLCKRYPTVFDLFLRGFMPKIIRDLFSKRLSRYEMSDVLNDKDVYWDPPIVSGCFMLFRTEVLKQIGGFDPRFFLYFEDFDISLRTAKISRIAYVPQVKVVHHGGHASRKGWKHIKLFGRSMITFFNIHGWRWW